MWLEDKLMLKAYRDCYRQLLEDMRNGEEVELSDACVNQTKALQNATEKAANYYKATHGIAVHEKHENKFKPLVPYFQNM